MPVQRAKPTEEQKKTKRCVFAQHPNDLHTAQFSNIENDEKKVKQRNNNGQATNEREQKAKRQEYCKMQKGEIKKIITIVVLFQVCLSLTRYVYLSVLQHMNAIYFFLHFVLFPNRRALFSKEN